MLPPQGQSGFLDLVRDPRQPVHALIQGLFRLSFRNGRLRMVLTSAHGTRLAFPELGGQRKGQRMKLSVPKRSAHRLAYLDCGGCDPIGKRRCFGCVTLQAVSLHGELYVVPLQLLLLLLHGAHSGLELLQLALLRFQFELGLLLLLADSLKGLNLLHRQMKRLALP
ncbi:Uncharacterised protein [Actinobacillus pleuropneumoniae]|nr:Uncharacterised protein [Actinobacillus pleuropneumoniae]